jgi:hypothetical protein
MDVLFGLLVFGGWRTGIDPGSNLGDVRVGERRLLVRHLRDIVMFAENGLKDQALRRVARFETRPDIAAVAHERDGVHSHPAFLLRCAVAAIAVLFEDRLHLAHIIDGLGEGCRHEQNRGEGTGFPRKHRA